MLVSFVVFIFYTTTKGVGFINRLVFFKFTTETRRTRRFLFSVSSVSLVVFIFSTTTKGVGFINRLVFF